MPASEKRRKVGKRCLRTKSKSVISKKGKILITDRRLGKWKKGIIITCKRCGKQAVVTEGSLCDLWKLCRKCARERLKYSSTFLGEKND